MSESGGRAGEGPEERDPEEPGPAPDEGSAGAPEEPPTPPAMPAMPRRRRRALRWLLGAATALVVLPILGLVLWIWATLSISFSEGRRVGYVQKFSRKGWVCKTWEGELAMYTVPGAVPQIFAFSVRDDAAAREIQRAMGEGRPVAIDYEQHRGVPTDCFGETEYFVVAVHPVQGSSALPSAPAAPRPAPAPAPAPAP